MIRLIRGWWYARLRRTDMSVLWPQLVEQAYDINHAKAAFTWHCLREPAWMFLGEKVTRAYIEALTGNEKPKPSS